MLPLTLRRSQAVANDASATVAFADVYREHVPSVWRWVQRLAGPGADVEDLVQDVFVIVHRKLPGFRHDSALSTWLYGITANVVRDDRRKQKLKALWTRQRTDRDDAPSMAAVAPELLEQRERDRRVYRVLDGLRERYRTVLILHELEGLRAEEIGALLGAKPANVWVWLHRARQAFARRLEELDAGESS